jgi:hypothetical protein
MGSGNLPVFGAGDRVNPPADDGLPAELKGKSAAEIHQYYQQREAQLRAELAAGPPPGPPPPPAPPAQPAGITPTDLWNNPTAAVDARIVAKALSKEEYNQVAAAVRPALVWAAKKMVMEKYPDFHRVEKEVDQIMSKIPEHQHTDPVMWETVFVQARGAAYERLSMEDRVKPPVITSEPVNPGSGSPPVEVPLDQITLPGVGAGKTAARVADLLGVKHEDYRKAQKRLEGEGLLPLTVDNRGAR